MIAEIFYPKELKDIIADLRAKDDLNEEALHFYNFYGFKIAAIFLVISCFLILVDERLVGISVLILIPVFCMIDLRSFYFKSFAAYLYGTKKSGVLKKNKLTFHGRACGRVFFCQESNNLNSDLVIIGLIYTPRKDVYYASRYPAIGDTVYYYHSNKGAMPCFHNIMRKYCLSKSMIEDASKNSEIQP
jgi:hypothetical protein